MGIGYTGPEWEWPSKAAHCYSFYLEQPQPEPRSCVNPDRTQFSSDIFLRASKATRTESA